MIDNNTCINICQINGPKENIEHIDRLLNEDFSMNSLISIYDINNNIDRLIEWGCEEDMELLTYISCGFNDPQTIDMTYITDIPNTLFLRMISSKYNLTIEHAFNDYVNGYVGYNKIVNGELEEFEYEEDNTSQKYIDLQKQYNFYSDEEMKEMELENTSTQQQTIISMQDILKLKNKGE